jgi:methylated-DNA-[protein]-cysteine S-methyltransferase
MKELFKAYCPSPIGTLEVAATRDGVASVGFVGKLEAAGRAPAPSGPAAAHLEQCLTELREYFEGKRTAFSVRLDLQGSAFDRRVWAELLKVPFGATTSYGELARAAGRPGAARAVGGANHRNPVAVIVPCHRVIGGDGSLVGYGAGLDRKAWLLVHERKVTAGAGKGRRAAPRKRS